ncbi:MAG: hypothetical protein ACYC7E_10215 [Armatimonadota bacterium]
MQEVESYPRQDLLEYGVWVFAILFIVAMFGLVLVLTLQGY